MAGRHRGSRRDANELVRPSSPPRDGPRWPLTPIDRVAVRWLIQGTWVFDADLDPRSMRHGLARLLDAYPLLCGRIVGGTAIEYRDRGVPFTVAADPTLAVDDFDSTRTDARRFADRRRVGRIKRGRDPLLTVKLTRLRDGWVLGVCCSHACLDGNGFYSMVRNWSRAATGRPFPRPVLDRPLLSPAELRPRAEVARRAREAGWQKVSILTFLRYLFSLPRLHERAFVARVSPDALRRCKHALRADSGCERLSTNTAFVAHLARCCVQLLGLAADAHITVSAAVDQRGRIAGLPDAFAGNAVSVVATPAIPASATPGEIAACLHRSLEPMLESPSAELEACATLTTQVAHHRLPYAGFSIANMLGRRPSHLYTNSFFKFPVYDLDFGDASRPARPVRAIPHELGDPVILWPAPPADGGGIELYFGGALARAVEALGDADPWWTELRRFGVDPVYTRAPAKP